MIVEDGAFLGSRCIVTEGVRIGAGAVLSANVSLTASVPIIDVTGGGARRAPRCRAAARRRRPRHASEGVSPPGRISSTARWIIGWRKESHDERLSLNETLREFELAV